MAVFEYSAMDLDAAVRAGTVIADTPRQARDQLRQRGLTVTEVRRLAETTGGTSGRRRLRRSARGEVTAFIRELATLLTAGIPLLSALNTLARQHRGRFRAVVQHLADEVASGTALADAMARNGGYFDDMCVNIVRVGENTGAIELALGRLAEFREKADRLRSRVITALIYPGIVATVGMAVTILLMTYVVPGLLETLTQSGRELPAITQVVKAVSDFLRTRWWVLLAAGAGGAVALRMVLRTQKGRLGADRLVLRIPVLGDLIRKETTSRMAVVLAALLRSGLDFVKAIAVTRRTLSSPVFRNAMDDYETAVTAGADIAASLEASGVFSPMVVQMLAVGQQSGQLEDMLEQLAASYEHQVDTAAQRLTALLEPILIVLLALMVGFIAFATILPILEMSNVL